MQDLQTVLKTISETTENGKTVPYATPTTSCESGGKYPLLFLPYLKLGLGIIGLLHNHTDSRWDKFKFFALKILGSREWKIQMSTLDTNPDHNHHLFSYSVNVHELHEVGHISIQERLLCITYSSHSEFSSPQIPMPLSDQELYISQNTGSRAGLVAEQGHKAVHTTTASAVLPVPVRGAQVAQQP